MSVTEMSQLRATIDALQRQIQKNTERIYELEKQIKNKDTKMPVEIHVFCVLLEIENWELELCHEQVLTCPKDNDHVVIFNPPENDETRKTERFYFEKVFDGFPPLINQFESTHLINSCLDGFNVFAFFYGAPEKDANTIFSEINTFIYLMADCIFNSNDGTPSADNWMYSVKASNWDTYDDDIIDLLADGKDWKPHAITKDLDGKGVHVSNLTQVEMKTAYEVLKMFSFIEKNRRRFMAKCKDDYRMCSVFQFHVQGYNTVTKGKKQGSVFIVQLAENESGDIKQVPDWESFIVQLASQDFNSINEYHKLMSFIEGNYKKPSKTLIYATVFPGEAHLWNSLNTLKFVSKLSTTNKKNDDN